MKLLEKFLEKLLEKLLEKFLEVAPQICFPELLPRIASLARKEKEPWQLACAVGGLCCEKAL